jgi:hypothetical protein
MIIFDKIVVLLVLLVAISAAIGSICADHYEAGARAGYEKGLEDGIRMTNEVIAEHIDDRTKVPEVVDCSWR